jgi:hypothetical protein
MEAVIFGNVSSGYYGGMEVCNLTNAYVDIILTNNSADSYAGIDLTGIYNLSLNGLIAGNRTTTSSSYAGGFKR